MNIPTRDASWEKESLAFLREVFVIESGDYNIAQEDYLAVPLRAGDSEISQMRYSIGLDYFSYCYKYLMKERMIMPKYRNAEMVLYSTPQQLMGSAEFTSNSLGKLNELLTSFISVPDPTYLSLLPGDIIEAWFTILALVKRAGDKNYLSVGNLVDTGEWHALIEYRLFEKVVTNYKSAALGAHPTSVPLITFRLLSDAALDWETRLYFLKLWSQKDVSTPVYVDTSMPIGELIEYGLIEVEDCGESVVKLCGFPFYDEILGLEMGKSRRKSEKRLEKYGK
jgi:hypothetical protein